MNVDKYLFKRVKYFKHLYCHLTQDNGLAMEINTRIQDNDKCYLEIL